MQLQSDNVSFSTKIAHLQEANTKLRNELEIWQEKASVAEEQHRSLRESPEEQFRKLHESHPQLQVQVENYAFSTNDVQNMLSVFPRAGNSTAGTRGVKKQVSLVAS